MAGCQCILADHQLQFFFNSRTPTPTILESEGLADEVNALEDDEPTPIPDWFQLDIGEIYDHLNPRTKPGQVYLRGWRKQAIDGNGKPLTSIGVVANRCEDILHILPTRSNAADGQHTADG